MRLDLNSPSPALDLHDPSLWLTEHQRQALTVDREVVVTAGAGAGKTHTLSLRYVVLLLELAVRACREQPASPRPDIEDVLVLTFTEKAAQEMTERCYRRLLALSEHVHSASAELIDNAWGPGTRAGLACALDRLLDHFDAARIGTFHGFFARILREFPGETLTAPGFATLDEVQTADLYNSVVDSVLAHAYGSDAIDTATLLQAVGSHREVVQGLLLCLRERAQLSEVLQQHAKGEIDVAAMLELFPLTPDQTRDWLRTEGMPFIERVLQIIGPSDAGGGPASQHLPSVMARSIEPSDDPFVIYSIYRDVLASLHKADGGPRTLSHHSVLGTNATWKTAGKAARIVARDELKLLQPQLAEWSERQRMARGLPVQADAEMLKALTVLAQLARLCISQLDERLADQSQLDFTGLQQRAIDAALSQPELLARLCARHRYIMVDEFQDTDQRQWHLVRALGRPAGVPSDRIFLVGDPKQSIYRFRGGDVEVFRSASEELAVEPTVLPDNFRSRPPLIDWFNHFFSEVLGRVGTPHERYEAVYHPIKAGRAATGGTVQVAIYDSVDSTTDAMDEAEAIARLLACSVLPGRGDFIGMNLNDRVTYPTPPVAILLRSRTRLTVYEDALRRHGVPALVAKGVGFWGRQEVLDCVNALHAIATGDAISMVGCLRSPLFCLSDHDLQLLVESEWGSPADGKHPLADFGRYELDDLAPRVVRDARALIVELRASRHRLSPSALLGEIVHRTCLHHALALADPTGQAEANVQRLIELTIDLVGRGVGGLTQVVDHFLSLIERGARESEAPITPTAARVLLMTVHASKGLEFPVVIVPESHRRAVGSTPSIVRGRLAGAWHIAS
ncbi:MAG: ATP-dependent helicase/nuclease subunit A, partial [Kiritimatiellia bacterium]